MRIYRSNRMERLADALGGLLAQSPAPPHQAEMIVVHGPGVARWLTMRLAQQLGICANVDFSFPARLVHTALTAMLEKGSATPEAWLPDRLLWQVLAALPTRLKDPRFAPLNTYLGEEVDPPILSRRRLSLAMRIATVFDRYITYRPRMAARWREVSPDDDWQPALWRAVAERAQEPNLADLLADFLRQMSLEEEPLLDHLPERLCLFGLSTLPPFHIDVLHALARHLEVHLFVLCPSQEYWGHIHSSVEKARVERKAPESINPEDLHLETGNSLLASFGRLGRDFQVLLEDRVESFSAESEDFEDPGRNSMLHVLQSDMLHLTQTGAPDGPRAVPVALADRSIEIHACHGAMRQVEVLRDTLVRLFAEMPALQPRDVLVMAPEIETFAPLIEAVFSAGDRNARHGDAETGAAGFPYLPYRIADRAVRSQNPIAAALLLLLELASGRVPLTGVFDFLGLDPVRRRFRLGPEDLSTLQDWMQEAGTRWGLDAEHRTASGRAGGDDNTWRAGMERLLLGYAMRGGEPRAFASRLPCERVGGRELLAPFAAASDILFRTLHELRQPRSMNAWRELLDRVLDELFAEAPDAGWHARQIRRQLNALAAAAAAAEVDTPLTLDTLRGLLEDRFCDLPARGGFLSGAVTFAGMVPLRSVPFRVVCLLGMDDDAFPRHDTRMGFDLVAATPQAGDRNCRDDDRYLMLEALLSARDRLILTYTARDVRDNDPLPPAVPLAELLDTMATAFRGAGTPAQAAPAEARAALLRQVCIEHPLQPFSPRNFVAGAPQGCDAHMQEAADRLLRQRRAPPIFVTDLLPEGTPATDAMRTLSIEDLARFLGDPIRFFFERRLQVWLREPAALPDDEDPLEPEGLEAWATATALLDRRLAGDSRDERFAMLKAAGRLPPGTPGNCLWEDLEAQIDPLARVLSQLRDGDRGASVAVDYLAGDTYLRGSVRHVWSAGHVWFRYSRRKAEHLLHAWVEHLALQVSAPAAMATHVVVRAAKSGGDLFHRRFTGPGPERAADLLTDLVDLYHCGRRAPLLLFPAAAEEFARHMHAESRQRTPADARVRQKAVAENGVPPAAIDAAATALRSAYFGNRYGKGAGPDVYLQRLFPTCPEDALLQDFPWPGPHRFPSLAPRVWTPLLDALVGPESGTA